MTMFARKNVVDKIDIVKMCQVNFSFRLPSDILHDRTKIFLDKITIGN